MLVLLAGNAEGSALSLACRGARKSLAPPLQTICATGKSGRACFTCEPPGYSDCEIRRNVIDQGAISINNVVIQELMTGTLTVEANFEDQRLLFSDSLDYTQLICCYGTAKASSTRLQSESLTSFEANAAFALFRRMSLT